ncbi:MAG: FAD-dependent oxidoreductase, partial [Pseudomonadota bacterium]
MKYSAFSIARQALRGDKDWPRVWRRLEPRDSYDAIVIGGGGHGLATAYYLARNHNMKRVALLEKGWLGSGNIGRNTTIVRSNYMLEGNQPFYEHSVKLWEGLTQDLNYNVMFSQRGIINLFHTDAQRDMYARRGNS